MTEVQREAEAEREKQRQLKLAKRQARPKRQRRLIRLAAVEELTGLKRSEIYDRVKRGAFPQQVQLAKTPGKAVAWVESEVEAYVDSLIARRDSKNGGART